MTDLYFPIPFLDCLSKQDDYDEISKLITRVGDRLKRRGMRGIKPEPYRLDEETPIYKVSVRRRLQRYWLWAIKGPDPDSLLGFALQEGWGAGRSRVPWASDDYIFPYCDPED